MTDRATPRVREPSTPTRTCVGCRRRDSWSALVRVVAVTDGRGSPRLVVDPAHRMPGRGAWLHPSPGCTELAVRRKAFGRALRLAHGPDVAAVTEYVAASITTQHHQPPRDQPKAGQTLMSTR